MSKLKYKPTKPKVSKKIKAQAKELVDPFFGVVAKVYGVPVNGISAIDGQPYLNKDGRLYLLDAICTGKREVNAIKTEFLKLSTTIIEPSIAKKIIVFKGGKEVEAIGEASQESVNSKSVKQTLNMVAETRALNRVIWVAIGADVMKRVTENIATLQISEQDKARLLEAGRSSYEEMQRPSDKEIGAKGANMYEATSKRIEEIKDDGKKLRHALSKVDGLPLNPEQKILIRRRIEGAIANALPSFQVGQKKNKPKGKK